MGLLDRLRGHPTAADEEEYLPLSMENLFTIELEWIPCATDDEPGNLPWLATVSYSGEVGKNKYISGGEIDREMFVTFEEADFWLKSWGERFKEWCAWMQRGQKLAYQESFYCRVNGVDRDAD